MPIPPSCSRVTRSARRRVVALEGADALRRLAAEEEVAGDAHERDHRQVLEHGGYAAVQGVARRVELSPPRLRSSSLAFVVLVHAGERLYQGGLPRAVVAEQAHGPRRGPRAWRCPGARSHSPKYLLRSLDLHQRRGVAVSAAVISPSLLCCGYSYSTITAIRSIAPRKTWNQSVFTPVKKMPWLTIPKMSAPNIGPITDP